MAQKHDGAHDHGAGHEGDKDKSYMQVPMSIE